MKVLHVEIPYEGNHCIPCVYMVEVVKDAVERFGKRVRWERVWIKTSRGAARFLEICGKLGQAAPVPSILIDGRLVFDFIPPVEDLEGVLEDMLADVHDSCKEDRVAEGLCRSSRD